MFIFYEYKNISSISNLSEIQDIGQNKLDIFLIHSSKLYFKKKEIKLLSYRIFYIFETEHTTFFN